MGLTRELVTVAWGESSVSTTVCCNNVWVTFGRRRQDRTVRLDMQSAVQHPITFPVYHSAESLLFTSTTLQQCHTRTIKVFYIQTCRGFWCMHTQGVLTSHVVFSTLLSPGDPLKKQSSAIAVQEIQPLVWEFHYNLLPAF